MDIFQSPHYVMNKRLLFYLGQWPLQTPGERRFYRSTTILLISSILVPKLIKLVECLGNVSGIIRCLPVLCIHAASAVKFFNCAVKSKEMRTLTDRIREDRNRRTAFLENDILIRYAERGRRMTMAYIAYMSTALLAYLSLPLMTTLLDIMAPLNQSRERIYLYETEYFVDQDENYFYLNLHAWITMPFAVGILIAYDTMLAVYISHACGIFAALGERLESLGDPCIRDKTYIDYMRRRDETYDNIVTCIKIHKDAVEYAALIESSGYMSCLFVVGINILGITLTGFMTVTNLDQPTESLRFAAFAIAAIISLFYPCWQGHTLMDHSQNIFLNAYNVDWYNISPRAKKLLIMIMIRSAEPCQLTAGKIFVLSMENFTTALKTSASYFTVLLSMQ